MKKILAKAIEINEDLLPTGKFTLIELNEEEYKKHRIIEELASMSLESDPMLNPIEGNENKPFVFWNPEDFENEENDKIGEILDKKNEEFEEILVSKLGLIVGEDEYSYIGDGYVPQESDKKENVQLIFMYGVFSSKPKRKYYTVNKLIEKLQSLQEEFGDVEVNIMIEDEDGNGSGFPLNSITSYKNEDEDEDEDELPSCVDLTFTEFDERKSDQDRIQNIEAYTPKETYTTDIGEIKVYDLGEGCRTVHILTCKYGGDKNIIKEIIDGEEFPKEDL